MGYSYSKRYAEKVKMSTKDLYAEALHGSLAGFAPTTIKDVVFDSLKKAIITGALRPGQRLVEHRIAPLLNVSRTPLREAIRLLEQERLVERLPQGGVRVASVSADEVRQLNDVRSVLEAYAARMAASNVAAGELSAEEEGRLQELRELLGHMSEHLEANDLVKLLNDGQQFHKTIHRLARNAVSEEMLTQTIGAMERYRALVPPSRNLATVDEHRAIADAIMHGQPDRAAALMTSHVDAAGRLYVATIRDLETEGNPTWNESS